MTEPDLGVTTYHLRGQPHEWAQLILVAAAAGAQDVDVEFTVKGHVRVWDADVDSYEFSVKQKSATLEGP